MQSHEEISVKIHQGCCDKAVPPELFLQSSQPLLLHHPRLVLLLLHPGTFGPQNERGLSSPGSGTETARCKRGDSCQTITSLLPFRKIRGLDALHSRQGPF